MLCFHGIGPSSWICAFERLSKGKLVSGFDRLMLEGTLRNLRWIDCLEVGW